MYYAYLALKFFHLPIRQFFRMDRVEKAVYMACVSERLDEMKNAAG